MTDPIVSGTRTTGYMTLPIPVIGNVFAVSNADVLPYTSAPSTDSTGFGRPDIRTSATYNQRGTPPVFWASLWNRCFSYIDDHYHATSNNTSWSHSGKKIGISALAPGTIDMNNQAFSSLITVGSPNAFVSVPYASLDKYSNPRDDSKTTFFQEFPEELGLPNDVIDPFKRRYSLFTMIETDDMNLVGAQSNTVMGASTEAVISSGQYAPSIALMWNCGSAKNKLCELVNNKPSGSVLGQNWLLSYMPANGPADYVPLQYSTGTGVWSEANFQDWAEAGDAASDWYVGISSYTRGRYNTTLRPFQGILDNGRNGYAVYSAATSSTGAFISNAFELQGQGVLYPQDNPSVPANYTITIYSGNRQPDPSLDIPRPFCKYMNSTTPPVFYSPTSSMKWFTTTSDSTWYGSTYSTLRTGKMVWITDFEAVANARPIIVNALNGRWDLFSGTGLEDTSTYLRWYEGGVQKTRTHTWAAGYTGDTLQITNDRGSVLIVKGPWEWAKNANGSVEENVETGGHDTFYAYFLS